MEALDEFYRDTAALNPPRQPRIFISHQRADTSRGERVACLVDCCGLDSWLDVHDPTLIAANRLPPNDPRRSLLIAVIIEMALLNSTHVIALHSASSAASRWVPYEFARAKSRKISSVQAAGWFEHGPLPETYGDYVQLGVITHDEPQVLNWLQKVCGVSFVTGHCCSQAAELK